MKNKSTFPSLFSKTSNDQIQQWQIFVEEDYFYTIEGLVEGKKTKSKPTFCLAKNDGKKNQTSANEQAYKEAAAKHKKKIESGYVEDISKIDEDTGLFEPMLAKKYGEVDFSFPVYEQPKLDGIRLIIKKDGMFSRNGKSFYSAPHIYECLKPLFEENPFLIFDGEMYNHDLKSDFNKIVSLAKKSKPTKEDLGESKKTIQYHVYDLPSSKKSFGARFIDLSELVKKVNSPIIQLVKTNFVESQEELDGIYQKEIEDGYEGQMIRVDAPYENKRSKYLLKRKEFIDEEATVLDIEEGKGARQGMFGRAICQFPNGVKFESNSRGDESFYIELLKNKKNYIGKSVTVRYQNLTPDEKKPRFPVITQWAREDVE